MKQKKFFIYLLAGLAVTLFSVFAHATQADEYQAEINTIINAGWQNYLSGKPNIQGGLALYIITPKGNFYASSNMPGGTAYTHFRTGSISKTFTAAAIMLLAQQGKIHIDDVITSTSPIPGVNYLPATSTYTNIPYASSITIRMLLDHRAGLFDTVLKNIPSTAPFPYAGQNYFTYMLNADPAHTFTIDEIINVISANSLSSFPPNTNYSYSNTGYILLGKIIEQVSNQQTYAQFVTNNFLVPNGLSNTTLPYLGTDQSIPAPYETGYTYTASSSTRATEANVSMAVAGGNVITTPSDIANWIRKLVGGKTALTPYTVGLMTSAIQSPNNYGLGLMLIPGLGIGHDGLIEGYHTVAFYDSQQDVAIVLSASVNNLDDGPIIEATMCNLGLAVKTIFGYPTSVAASDLSRIVAFPNPFNPKKGRLTVVRLTAGATIKIYNVAGELVRSLEYTSGNGQITWDGKNNGGSLVASGVYIMYIDSPAGSKMIKVAIQK